MLEPPATPEEPVRAYDDELTPGADPPAREPPPPGAVLRMVFMHGAAPRIIVRAPLHPAKDAPPDFPSASIFVPIATSPATSAKSSAGPAGWPEREEPTGEDRPERPRHSTPPDGAMPTGHAAPPEHELAVRPEAATPPGPASGRVVRWCEMCGLRVEVEAGSDRCPLRHRLSPAHAKRRFGFLRHR